jgi:hypothetical protein
MSIFAIRHALSEANNRNNIGTLAFASKDAPLMDPGREQARRRASMLLGDYGINAAGTPAAVSSLLRTEETARVMGFQLIKAYEQLDEVEHGMSGPEFRALLDNGRLPQASLDAAEVILQNPPSEKVWITHGLVIAGLSQVLGVSDQFERLIPKFCEVRELPMPLTEGSGSVGSAGTLPALVCAQ